MSAQGKLALITGASSGIGEATARAFAASGYRVVLVARGVEKLKAVADAIGERAIVEACDASDGAAVLAMADRVMKRDGVPEVIVNCAGAGLWKYVEHTTPAEMNLMMQAPYFSAFNITHAFMNALLARKSGVIVHVGSPASMFPWAESTGYVAARWALRGLNEALNQDLAGTGVHSCHAVFARVDSPYFANNGVGEEKIPSIAKTIRTMAVSECAQKLVGLAANPRREALWPFMLRVYALIHWVMPWLVLWLLRVTGPKRK